MANSSKVKLLRVLDILRETDEEHPYTAGYIVQQLALYGIEAEKKSVLRDIKTLQDYGYDIVLHSDNKLGYFFASREFEDWELNVLMDAVAGATFLTMDESRDLTERISKLSSQDGEKTLRASTLIPTSVKIGDPTTKNAIDLILKAIRKKRKVTFQYTEIGLDMKPVLRFDGMEYVVSPYALIWRQDKYYLICSYGKRDSLSYYRLDRIRNLTVSDEPIVPMESFLGPNADLQMKEFVDRNIYNHGGEPTVVKLAVDPEATNLLYDTFGSSVEVSTDCDGQHIAMVKVNDGFGLDMWLLQHGDYVQVLEPERVRAEVIGLLELIRGKYGL